MAEDSLRELLARLHQQLGSSGRTLDTEARQLLNEIYDSFVERHGPLSSRDNVKAFAGDVRERRFPGTENVYPMKKAQ